MLELRPGAAKLNKKYPQRPTVQHRQLCSMLFGSLDEGSLREHGYSIYMTDSLSFSSETITTLSMGYTSVQFSRSVAQSCPTLCNPVNRSTPGLPVHHRLPEFTQTHVHQVRDAIQPSPPRSSPSPPAPNPSQHQSLFQ